MRTRYTMSIPKLRQVCEGDVRSSRRQMAAALSTLCIGSRVNERGKEKEIDGGGERVV